MPPSQDHEAALFALAVRKPVSERESFLQAVCGSDKPLRQRLDALLSAHEQPETLLTTQADAARPTIKLDFADAPGEAVGQTLGRYKLLERVGEGGCGVVYVAEQTEPVRRRVALKVIKLGMDTKQVVARFEAERQALAMMDHPNIAKVLDAGATELGRPYFVMELVRGIPITSYCDQSNLTTKERLDLFIKVCQAIQHAHQKGIIHRDIKPSNILVTVNDGQPAPKVIDFGIAKATEGRLTDATVYTQLHQFIGTPAYMSPEQAEMTSLDIDTRSDIYSLGVLLYELLSGRTPFEAKELMAAGLDTMRRTIREQEPARPSTKLATLKGDEQSTTAKRRSTEAPKLLKQLAGDLDWITMKCLEKDRTRRYETANGLAADLTRHLTNEPVLARPPSTSYRFQKAYQRNKSAFAVAALFAVVLMAATAFSAWQARVARKSAAAERLAKLDATARAAAERTAREEAETIAKLLADVFRSPDPKQDGRAVTVAATLDRAARKLETELAAQPARRAVMQAALAETYLGLSLFKEAQPLLEKVLAHQRATLGEENTNTLQVMVSLAEATYGVGRLEEALKLRDEVRRLRLKVLGPEHPDTLDTATALVQALATLPKRREEARKLTREVAEIRLRRLGPDDLKTRQAQLALALFNYEVDDEPKRTAMAQQAAEILEKVRQQKGPRHPETLSAMHTLAYTLPFSKAEEKLRLSEETLALERQIYGPEHADSINTLANLGWFQGRTEQALRTFQEVVRLCVTTYGPNHERTLSNQMKVAQCLFWTGQLDEALRLAEETMPKLRKASGEEEDGQLLAAMDILAAIYGYVSDGKRRNESVELVKEAIAITRKYQPGTADELQRVGALADMLTKFDRHEEAMKVYAELEPLNRKVNGTDSRDFAGWMTTIGNGYAAAGQPGKAIGILEEVLPLCQKHFGAEGVSTTRAMNTLAKAYFGVGRSADGHRMLEALSNGSPGGVLAVLTRASLRLWDGDSAGYTALRDRWLPWAAGTTNLALAERVSKLACLQATSETSVRTNALALARHGVELGRKKPGLPWLLLSLGMAEFRNGDLAAAEVTFAEVTFAEVAGWHTPAWLQSIPLPTVGFYRAMISQQQGNSAEARKRFAEAEAKMRPLPADEKNPMASGADHDVLVLWLAYREAKALLQP